MYLFLLSTVNLYNYRHILTLTKLKDAILHDKSKSFWTYSMNTYMSLIQTIIAFKHQI